MNLKNASFRARFSFATDLIKRGSAWDSQLCPHHWGIVLRAGFLPTLELKVGGFLQIVTRWLAYSGGLLLVAIALMTLATIMGRALIPLGLSTVPGDVELTEMGAAIAVFCFLPWCQMQSGHVTVDVVTNSLPRFLQKMLILLGQLALAVAACLIAWRHFAGYLEKTQYGETTFILGIPVWWGFLLSLFGAILFAVTAVFTVWRAFNDWRSQGTPTPLAGKSTSGAHS